MVVEAFREVGVKEKMTTDRLASALESIGEIQGRMTGKRLAVFLDYDGTLTPIVERPEQAVLSAETREVVEDLASLCPLAVISGRDLRDVRDLVGIKGIYYAGSHGFDIAGPAGHHISVRQGEEFLPQLDELEIRLRDRLRTVDGSEIERKTFSIAVHYRRVASGHAAEVERVVDEELAKSPQLRKTLGKKVFDLQPRIDWHKGKALIHLLNVLHLDGADVLPIFLGDDLTDEDAFESIAGRGIGIVVRDEVRPTAAQFALESAAEVRRFLEVFAKILREQG
ncbi:MAG: trehalose-phosphatase [Bryobacterales bacterium]